MTAEAAGTNVVSGMLTATSTDGQRIAYWRQGSGPPLLLVHGALSDRTAWILIQPLLAEHFTVYAMNRRGREGSGEPAAHPMEREFEDIIAVMDAIGEPVHLVGLSDIGLLRTDAPIIRSLRTAINTGGGIAGIRFTNNVVNGNLIEDAYIYRVA